MTVGVIDGLCRLEANAPGPVHDHAVASLELSLSVTEPVPAHIGLLFVAPVDDGTAFTETVAATAAGALVAIPQTFVTTQ